MRIGFGYDVHKLVENRALVLGGIKIEHHLGLLGHSDADVLIHSLMDALLGASALGDIGKLFPDNDDSYKDINSLLLLEKVINLIRENNYCIVNADITVVAQEPKLAPYILSMRQKLSEIMKVDINQISIKATTEEGLGFTGKKEGIASYAVCLIEEKKNETL